MTTSPRHLNRKGDDVAGAHPASSISLEAIAGLDAVDLQELAAELQATKAPLADLVVVWKELDEKDNNSSALQDDNELFLPIAADAVRAGLFVVFTVGHTSADVKLAVTAPAGAEMKYMSFGPRAADTVYASGSNLLGVADNAEMTQGDTGFGTMSTLRFWVANGANAGLIRLRWAQNVPTVADTAVKRGSHGLAWRMP